MRQTTYLILFCFILRSYLIKLAQSSKKGDMIEVNKPINIFEPGAWPAAAERLSVIYYADSHLNKIQNQRGT